MKNGDITGQFIEVVSKTKNYQLSDFIIIQMFTFRTDQINLSRRGEQRTGLRVSYIIQSQLALWF